MLAQAGVGLLRILEDDVIDRSNLHRQILFTPEDVGQDKLAVGVRALQARFAAPHTRIEGIPARLLPDNARSFIADVDLVIEGSDNFATKFLAADASFLEHKPCVQGSAVRWVATALCGSPEGQPCYRCLFEDLPAPEQSLNCAEAGVVGPVVGLGAAMMVQLALDVLTGNPDYTHVSTYDGRTDVLRKHPRHARANCELCGAPRTITDTDWSRYDAEYCRA